MIKAVLFDVDGVLLNSFEANLKFLNDLMTMFGKVGPTREEYKNIFHSTLIDVIKIYTKGLSEEEIKVIYAMAMSSEMNYDTSLVSTPERIEETIHTLQKSYRLGIVTSREQEAVFEGPFPEELKKCFEVIVAYEDTKNHKPSPDPLILAAQRLGLNPVECVYVGDTRTDIIAAQEAGMKCILYGTSEPVKPDASTVVFGDLPEVIKNLV